MVVTGPVSRPHGRVVSHCANGNQRGGGRGGRRVSQRRGGGKLTCQRSNREPSDGNMGRAGPGGPVQHGMERKALPSSWRLSRGILGTPPAACENGMGRTGLKCRHPCRRHRGRKLSRSRDFASRSRARHTLSASTSVLRRSAGEPKPIGQPLAVQLLSLQRSVARFGAVSEFLLRRADSFGGGFCLRCVGVCHGCRE